MAAFLPLQTVVLYGDTLVQEKSDKSLARLLSFVLPRSVLPIVLLGATPLAGEEARRLVGLMITLYVVLGLQSRSTHRCGSGRTSHPAKTRLPFAHRGRRGIPAAALTLLWARFRIRGGGRSALDLLRDLGRGVLLLHGPLLAAIAVAVSRKGIGLAVLLAAFAATAPQILALPRHPRLWFLGADAGRQRRASLVAVVCCAALPTVLTAIAVNLAVSGRPEVVLLLVAFFLLRIGTSPWIPPGWEPASSLVLILPVIGFDFIVGDAPPASPRRFRSSAPSSRRRGSPASSSGR